MFTNLSMHLLLNICQNAGVWNCFNQFTECVPISLSIKTTMSINTQPIKTVRKRTRGGNCVALFSWFHCVNIYSIKITESFKFNKRGHFPNTAKSLYHGSVEEWISLY
jgi:hypothetical protein